MSGLQNGLYAAVCDEALAMEIEKISSKFGLLWPRLLLRETPLKTIEYIRLIQLQCLFFTGHVLRLN